MRVDVCDQRAEGEEVVDIAGVVNASASSLWGKEREREKGREREKERERKRG